MTYYENRAVLRDNDAEVELEVRGGVAADDLSNRLELVFRSLGDLNGSTEKRMRVSSHVWQQFIRAVGRLK